MNADHKIPYGKQSLDQADIDAVMNVLQSDFWTQGPEIAAFESAFAAYVGAEFAVAVSSGTAALHVCALALGVADGDTWLVPPLTFAASANCILYCGGKVEFVDIDPETWLISPEALSNKLENAPKGTYKGIVAVDFAGNPVQMDSIREIADEYGLRIIEDACHAPGGWFTDGNGQRQFCGNGGFADLAIFSFHPVKHIAAGEGGMVTTNDPELYKKLQLFRTHGITKRSDLLEENHGGWYYEMHELGYNYRLSSIHAALGLSQLGRADEGLQKRREIAAYYDQAFNATNVRTPISTPEAGHAYHLYVIRVKNRKELYDHLRAHKIYSQVHYIPVHYLPYYKRKGWKKGDFPHSEHYYDECLSIPIFPNLTREEQDFVIEKILECAK